MGSQEGASQTPTRFAIASNTRNGSTWLATALGQLGPDVRVDFEVKLEGYRRSTVHYPLSPEDAVKQFGELFMALQSSGPAWARAVGTKITLDPTVEPHHGNAISERLRLLARIGAEMPDVRFIHLTRDLCAQNQSTGGHSPNNPSVSQGSRNHQTALVANAMEEAAAAANPPRLGPHSCQATTVLHQSLNDMCVAAALSRSDRYLHVAYESLHEDFPRILQFLELPPAGTLADLSVTAKNPRIAPATSCELGRRMSNLRDIVVDKFAGGECDPVLSTMLTEASGVLLEDLFFQVREAHESTEKVTRDQLLKEIRSRASVKLRLKRS